MITGVRQSRRLAALAEAPSHSPPEAHAAQQPGTAHHQQEQPPQQAEPLGATQSAALPQASTLEASANVLKSLVSVLTVHHAAQGFWLYSSLHHAAPDPKGLQPQDHSLDVQGGLAMLQQPRLHHA